MARPTHAEIDISALRHNLKEIQAHVGHVPVCATVKADAYGHNDQLVCRTFAEMNVRHWGVHCLEEALALRQGGGEGSIFVLGGTYSEEISAYIDNGLTPVIHSESNLKEIAAGLAEFTSLNKTAKAMPKKMAFHLKLDTGMGRLGVLPEELESFLQCLKGKPHLEVTGILGHLPMAENRQMALQQKKLFQDCLALVKTSGVAMGKDFLCHHTNSIASILYPEMRFDMVRPGLILYGIYPDPGLKKLLTLKPVMNFCSKIISIRDIPAATGLSYGHTYVTRRASKIATLPVGYADGYPRLCSNRAEVLIRGHRAPLVGRVCMDMILIDVTDIAGVALGDRVVLFGQDGEVRLPVEEISNIAQTIPYEILCGISPRVPRTAVN